MNSNPESKEFSPETVEQCLTELNEHKVFNSLRAAVNSTRSFFDPENGFIEEDDKSRAQNVLSFFVECLEAEEPRAMSGFKYTPDRLLMIEALKEGSLSRKIIEAYYGIDETTIWVDAEHSITVLQSFNRQGFPDLAVTDWIYSRLTGKAAEQQDEYDLEHFEMDWKAVKPNEENAGRWSFEVQSKESGRKIAWEFAKAINVLPVCEHALASTETYEEPYISLRLDGGQISFVETNENLITPNNPRVVEILIKMEKEDPEYHTKFRRGIDAVLEKINR